MAANPMLFKALLQFFDGLLHQLLVNLAGENGEEWYEQLGKFLRKEITWGGGLMEENAFAVVGCADVGPSNENQRLHKHHLFNYVQVDEESDKDLLDSTATFSPYTKVLIGLTTHQGTNLDIFSKHLNAIGDLESLRLAQAQISAFCSTHTDKLTFSKHRCIVTLFMCTIDDRPIRKNLSNLRIVETMFRKDKALIMDQRRAYIRKFYAGQKDSVRTDGIHFVIPFRS